MGDKMCVILYELFFMDEYGLAAISEAPHSLLDEQSPAT